MAIAMRLNTRRRTAVATTTRLPRYARNDKVGTREQRVARQGISIIPVIPARIVTRSPIPVAKGLGVRAGLADRHHPQLVSQSGHSHPALGAVEQPPDVVPMLPDYDRAAHEYVHRVNLMMPPPEG